MPLNFLQHTFLSSLGRHTLNSLGKDLGFDDILKVGKEIEGKGVLSPEHFQRMSHGLSSTDKLLSVGVKIGTSVATSLIANGVNSLTNPEKKSLPLVSNSSTSPVGKNDAKYLKTYVHVGEPTSKRLKQMRNNPNVDYDEKLLASSNKDYQEHEKRINLSLTTGFNEKGFCFLLEDTIMTVDDYLKFYNKNRITATAAKRRNGTIDLYGCAYKTKNNFKFVNKFEFYDLHLQIHLIKIHDVDLDVRRLIELTVNTKDASEPSSSTEDIDRPYQIHEDLQYSNVSLKDKKNKITAPVITSLKCNLNDSLGFKESATIVQTWRKVLTPASIWDFNFHHHLGNGIHMNSLLRAEKTNKDRPTGYAFVLEYFGDRRGKIVRNKDGDFFRGYSPTSIHMDFDIKFCYLYDTSKGEEDQAACYQRKKREEDFLEDGQLIDIFTPDREEEFHVEYDDILLPQDSKQKKAKWTLEFDQSIVASADNILLREIKRSFEENGMDPTQVTEDDAKYNLRRPPSKPDKQEYEGTEDNIINLDE